MTKFFRTIPKAALLLVFAPVAVAGSLLKIGAIPEFAFSALGILGVVVLIGKATEEYSIYAGPIWGGLLHATFGNVTELIIALFALKAGMYEMVRASITGSILGNLLLVLGAAMLYGGLKHPRQEIQRTGAGATIGMLILALVGLVVPSIITLAYRFDPSLNDAIAKGMAEKVSLSVAVILLVIYGLSLLFSLGTHRFIIMPNKQDEEKPEWTKTQAIVVLFVATALVAWLSEVFVASIQYMLNVQHINVSELFVGVVVVAVVGNATEGSVAIFVARENKMELSFQIAMGSCIQVALMVAPLLVIASFVMGKPMTLAFNLFELVFIWSGVLIASASLQDGETNWLEGAMFLAVYVLFALVFWFHP